MKPLLNTLFVTADGAYLSRERETVLVKVGETTKAQIPVRALSGIVCFGHATASPYLLELCASQGVSITFLTSNGRYLARLEGRTSGNVLLRRSQYRSSDDPVETGLLARSFVFGKVLNSRHVLLRALRDHPQSDKIPDLRSAIVHLRSCLRRVRIAEHVDDIRGIEGEASASYFSVFDVLITAQKEDFQFRVRSRRPPMDNVNCLLSFVYTLLMHDCRNAAESIGLDPQAGFLHRDRPGRPSLALDLMEEFRAPFADRLVISLINRKQVTEGDFEKQFTGGVKMNDDARKTVLMAYQQRKQDEIDHPFLGERVRIGHLFVLQARLLAHRLRHDLDGYPPFYWK